MEQLAPLAKYGTTGIVIAALGVIIYIVKTFLSHMEKSESRHVEAFQEFKNAINANTEVTKETYTYLKLRNGSMDRVLTELGNKVDKLGN